MLSIQFNGYLLRNSLSFWTVRSQFTLCFAANYYFMFGKIYFRIIFHFRLIWSEIKREITIAIFEMLWKCEKILCESIQFEVAANHKLQRFNSILTFRISSWNIIWRLKVVLYTTAMSLNSVKETILYANMKWKSNKNLQVSNKTKLQFQVDVRRLRRLRRRLYFVIRFFIAHWFFGALVFVYK